MDDADDDVCNGMLCHTVLVFLGYASLVLSSATVLTFQSLAMPHHLLHCVKVYDICSVSLCVHMQTERETYCSEAQHSFHGYPF